MSVAVRVAGCIRVRPTAETQVHDAFKVSAVVEETTETVRFKAESIRVEVSAQRTKDKG